jgi:hypothetical protein
MPLFLEKNLFFIHIPKTGGTSIEKIIIDSGVGISLFTATGSVSINGHSPQHLTFREIQELGLDKDKFRFFAVIRDPLERVISEYNYLAEKRPDISMHFRDVETFLDLFLNHDNSHLFDNHNLSNTEYLINKSGKIDPRICLVRFFDHVQLEQIIGLTGLNNIREQSTHKHITGLQQQQIDRIRHFYHDDYLLLKRLP